jgi:hypothetical protein
MFSWIKSITWDSIIGTADIIEGRATTTKPKRARTKGRYKADNKATKHTNEAWVGGVAPKKKKKKKKTSKK